MGTALLLLAACSGASPAGEQPSWPVFDGKDASRPRVEVALSPVLTGFKNVTDLQFPPGESGRAVVLEKRGVATWVELATDTRRELLTVDVRTNSELGLLGLAFHPKYAENHRIYTNTNPSGGELRTTITEWTVDQQSGKAGSPRVLLEIAQPYSNHDGGQLAFGPDGYLYIGMGDGGSAGDPQGHGQDRSTLLGAMLRIDVDRADPGLAYAVPQDNPFVGTEGVRPEIWAYGLRNPWRYSFDPKGRLLVADVGQNLWEEVDVVARGDNLGWNVREGRSCFEPETGCATAGMVDPLFVYGHDEGASITGGYVSLSPGLPALQGWWIFGDFASGRLWALDARGALVPGQDAPVVSLGRWDLNPATFGRAADGTVYVVDFPSGTLYRIGPSR